MRIQDIPQILFMCITRPSKEERKRKIGLRKGEKKKMKIERRAKNGRWMIKMNI